MCSRCHGRTSGGPGTTAMSRRELLQRGATGADGPRLTLPGSHVTAWVIPVDKRLLVARRTQTFLG